ncbi:MAG: hypothetical protein NXY57DRAFT_1084645 [Lentinula lateritia]|uniref:tRNA-splicing endonuclease subunit Sen54 N-terminal domain-containing protein n=1 Tax=Lentinula lateritia TaxID=40482 RepID=A0ABQ8VG45_9AGAR|nr:MAG: hypothetical protein NXY57DRAFT_1084645 [Lentinula lateritia]KAJ4491725.1 hypothetical protein C8R41DRAFT_895908 [Lentinula lateritia]
MDDNLELPNNDGPEIRVGDNLEEEDQSSGDEDEGPDWIKLMPKAARPVIPKRGDKEFEPSKQGGSGLQQHILQRARNAIKSISYGTWHPSLARVSVTVSRGISIGTVGHSVPRETAMTNGTVKTQKRMELLPEEAIYLIERGSLLCWKESAVEYPNDGTFESISGSPMTVQQAYTEMIGKEDLTMDRYQVYAYLKRLGYTVTRTKPPTAFYPLTAPFPPSLLTLTSSSSCNSKISALFSSYSFDWWRPLRIRRWLKMDKNYSFIFQSLRFIPSGHKVPQYSPTETQTPSSPYEPFFNLYKPPTPFKKSAPPPPDYQMVVVNARTTPMPSLRELTAIYDNAPELPPPQRRVRNPPQIQGISYKNLTGTGGSDTLAQSQTHNSNTPTWMSSPSMISLLPHGLTSWLYAKPTSSLQKVERRPNPFAVLRQGKKTAIIATVDAGTINIFRFAQGAFETGPWF